MEKLLGREVAVIGVGMHPWGKFPQEESASTWLRGGIECP